VADEQQMARITILHSQLQIHRLTVVELVYGETLVADLDLLVKIMMPGQSPL
jgi:hypothetical protein